MFSLILRSRFSIHVFQADFDISVGEGKFKIIADKAVVIGEFSCTEYWGLQRSLATWLRILMSEWSTILLYYEGS